MLCFIRAIFEGAFVAVLVVGGFILFLALLGTFLGF